MKQLGSRAGRADAEGRQGLERKLEPMPIILAIFVGIIGFQLVTGKAYRRTARPPYSRQHNPRMYWTMIALQTLMMIVVVAIWGRVNSGGQ